MSLTDSTGDCTPSPQKMDSEIYAMYKGDIIQQQNRKGVRSLWGFYFSLLCLS